MKTKFKVTDDMIADIIQKPKKTYWENDVLVFEKTVKNKKIKLTAHFKEHEKCKDDKCAGSLFIDDIYINGRKVKNETK